MYNKVCLVGPTRHAITESQVTDALEYLTDKDEVNCILVGSLSSTIGKLAAEFANERRIQLEVIEAKHEELGNDASTRQIWDFIQAKTDLFVIFPPYDVTTHNTQVLATYAGCAQWLPYDG